MGTETGIRRLASRPAVLVLADGTVFRGAAFGARCVRIGEVCFNTSMSGYQEILTDPSYAGQLVTLTSAHIGNYGVNSEDEESTHLWLSGLIVRECSRHPSNFRSAIGLPEYLKQHGIPGIERVDTRMLTRRVRETGAINVMLTEDIESQSFVPLGPLAVRSGRLAGIGVVTDETYNRDNCVDRREDPPVVAAPTVAARIATAAGRSATGAAC